MQQWLIILCSVVFLLSCANTYIQAKRRGFILTCLGITGILFCLSFLIAAISLPENKPFNDLNKSESIICYITGIILAIQIMALLSIIFALSIELYVKFRIENRAIKDSLILKSIIVFFCCFQPTLFIILNIILMLIKNIQIVYIVEDGGWCNVRVGGNPWGVLFIRALPLWFISIPGTLIACAAIIPSLITAIKTRRGHRESYSQSETNSRNPTVSSRSQISREASNDRISESLPSDLSPQNPKKIPNDAITRMALYCILYSAIGIPYSIYGLIQFFNHWRENKTLDFGDTLSNCLSVGISLATLILIFLIFATNDSSIKQYKEAGNWWRNNCFNPICSFITRQKNDSMNVNMVRSNLEKEPRESVTISIRAAVPEENANFSSEVQEEPPANISLNKNSITLKTKKRWSIFTSSRESLVELEKVKKVRQSTEDTVVGEDSSPAVNQKMNRHNNLSMSSSSTYSSVTAIVVDSSESSSSKNNELSNKSTVPILGGLSPAPRRTLSHSNPLRDYNDDKDDETLIKRSSSPQIRSDSTILRQTASAPTSPISRSNSMRTSSYNQPRRFTSPLRKPSTPIINNGPSLSTSTSYSQETPTTNTTSEGVQEIDDDEAEPFPSLLKIGKTFNDEKGTWRSLTFSSRPIRMSSSRSNLWDRPDSETTSGSSPSPTTTGDIDGKNYGENGKSKKG